MKQLKPLAGYVLIETLDEEETTASGLIMPEKAKEKPAKGKVIATGEDILGHVNIEGDTYFTLGYDQHCPVEEGDICIFHRWSGQDVKEGQKEYKLVKFSDLMGRYE